MSNKIELLDCTLRDGAYITNSHFGVPVIKGIIKKMQDAHVDIIECGWLKDKPHEVGSSFYHVPADIEPYLIDRSDQITYVTMIDWDRYNVDALPPFDGKSIDAIRVVFPHGRHREGIAIGQRIRDKGYRVYFQAANTLAYSNRDLIELAECMNEFKPESLSVVDTFGAMYADDLERIVRLLDSELDPSVKLGFHSHNNQQLSFALSIRFCEMLQSSARSIVVDASLCGMGRGAGNATLELVASYLDKKQHGNYDLDEILDAIDVYMHRLQEKYSWGYSIPYFISGLYQCHVNNIAYLLKNHRTNAKDMRGVISSLSQSERRKYDYDLLERKYIEHQSRQLDDHSALEELRFALNGRTILLLAPGRSIDLEVDRIKKFIDEHQPLVIGVNAIDVNYDYDYMFFVNSARYDYAREVHADKFGATKKILLSNIKTTAASDELIINFERAIKRGWEHYDNAVICCLRLMNKLGVKDVVLAGFDGFKDRYNESYADADLPSLNPGKAWGALNDEIKEMFGDLRRAMRSSMTITFLTDSIFDVARD
ncbi:MAG: hypothetical protein IJU71_06580 [Selenomonadaceae bacterium]|nr:hypothetical protein [Selenomonadaceae bacterium]